MACFTVPGKPVGKARPRVVRHGGRTVAYTPKKTADYEELVRWQFKAACKERWMEGEPLEMKIMALYEIPKSASKKAREQMESNLLRPTKKPDADNIAKAICDALNGLAYKDDSQIVQMAVTKRYTAGKPEVQIVINEARGEEYGWLD